MLRPSRDIDLQFLDRRNREVDIGRIILPAVNARIALLESGERLRSFLVGRGGIARLDLINVFACFQADRDIQRPCQPDIELPRGVDIAHQFRGHEGAVIEILGRCMRIDEERAVARIPGVDVVDILAVAARDIDIPTGNIELEAEIILIIVFLDHFLGRESQGREDQFARREQSARLAGGDDLPSAVQAGRLIERVERGSRDGIGAATDTDGAGGRARQSLRREITLAVRRAARRSGARRGNHLVGQADILVRLGEPVAIGAEAIDMNGVADVIAGVHHGRGELHLGGAELVIDARIIRHRLQG